MTNRLPRILLLILMIAVIAGLSLWLVRRPAPVKMTAVEGAGTSFERVLQELAQRDRHIRAHLTGSPLSPESNVPAPDPTAAGELASELACRARPAACRPGEGTDINMRDRLEKIEAHIHLEDLTDADSVGELLLEVLRIAPGHAALAASLLAELPDGRVLLRALAMGDLDPLAKAHLISAALDPADETLKTRLRETARRDFESMIESGNSAEAFAASTLFSQFKDLPPGELARLGRSLCRFGQNPAQAFVFENIKLKIRREAATAPRLRGLLSDCQG